MTSAGEIQQSTAHFFESARLAPQFVGPRHGERLDLAAGALVVGPQGQQRADFLDRKADVAGIGNEPQPVDVGVAVIPVATVATCRGRDKRDLLVVADHPLRDAAGARGLPDVHSGCRLSRSALATTLAEDSAIAAAAIIGESNMPDSG